MRQKLQNLFFLFLLGTIGAKAQVPVIYGTDPILHSSDGYVNEYVHSNSINTPDSGGANRIWDYSSLVDSGVGCVIPIGVSTDNNFPSANLPYPSGFFGIPNTIDFMELNDTFFKSVGAYLYDSTFSTIIDTVRYNPPLSILNFPITYNDKFTDSSAEYINSKFVYTIYDTIMADGYGTLLLPIYDGLTNTYIHTFYHVLRVKEIKAYVSPTNSSLNKSTVSYAFYNGSFVQLLELDNVNGSGWTGNYFTGVGLLPLQISSFTASWQNKMPYLQWEAANTENTKAFNIQRSNDGHSFSTVGQVGVSGGSSYHFEDNYIPTTTVYYRIEQVDKNGQMFYSSTARLTVNGQPLTVFPNPAKGTIHVSVPSGNTVYVMIYDAIGRLVYENKNYSAAQSIATDTWSKGTYLVRVKDNEGWKDSSFVIN